MAVTNGGGFPRSVQWHLPQIFFAPARRVHLIPSPDHLSRNFKIRLGQITYLGTFTACRTDLKILEVKPFCGETLTLSLGIVKSDVESTPHS